MHHSPRAIELGEGSYGLRGRSDRLILGLTDEGLMHTYTNDLFSRAIELLTSVSNRRDLVNHLLVRASPWSAFTHTQQGIEFVQPLKLLLFRILRERDAENVLVRCRLEGGDHERHTALRWFYHRNGAIDTTILFDNSIGWMFYVRL